MGVWVSSVLGICKTGHVLVLTLPVLYQAGLTMTSVPLCGLAFIGSPVNSIVIRANQPYLSSSMSKFHFFLLQWTKVLSLIFTSPSMEGMEGLL